ncbi:MAG TPA: adenylate kinase [Actinomycetota bacterium]|nr:adenylate kinase [Actinomycetota bacterium]
MRIILLGPPGAGKGTQARRLSERYGLVVIATGDIFRAQIAAETALGMRAKEYYERGEYVPDDLTTAMVLERLQQPDVREGFILDGYPRTVPQAQALEGFLAESGHSLSAVLNFKISDAVAVKRLMGRRVCPNCGRSYNIEFKPPRVEGTCDVCGHELTSRSDDDEETIVRRLEVYHRETKPLVLYFWERGLLRDIESEAPEEVVADRTIEAIADLLDTYE